MTKKDYVNIASSIMVARTKSKLHGWTGEQALNYFVGHVSGHLVTDNSRFDFEKFAVAAGAKAKEK